MPLESQSVRRARFLRYCYLPVVIRATASRRILRPRILKDLKEWVGTIGGGGIRDLGHVDKDGSVVGAADSFIGTRAVAVLLMHLYSYGAASWDAALGGCGSVIRIAADIVACDRGDGTVAVWQPGAGRLVWRC